MNKHYIIAKISRYVGNYQHPRQDFTLDSSWHGKDTVATVVSILITKQPLPRQYVLAEEVEDKVKITDSGHISALKEPVFSSNLRMTTSTFTVAHINYSLS